MTTVKTNEKEVLLGNPYVLPNNKITGDLEEFKRLGLGGVPSGYIRVSSVPTPVAVAMRKLLSLNYGTMIPLEYDNVDFLIRIEPHFHPHPPANATDEEKKKYPKPWGPHKGATAFQSKEPKKELFPEENDKVEESDEKLLAKLDKFLLDNLKNV